ncbi:MAG: tyrosine-type recombinase/integrase [Alphaproteobacteria bacterium]|nr:tyrosine-type recombinase/integrase [Alphaproteobacteria bacterium]
MNNHLGILSKLFKKAIDWRYAEVNPVTGVGALKVPPQDMDFWVPAQSNAFLDAARERDDWYPFFLCALRTGMRLGEILALRWDDVDFSIGTIFAQRSFSHGAMTTPKNGRSRHLPM